MTTRTPYTKQWRDRIRKGVLSSADALVPLLINAFHPATAVDLGCGEGHFVDQFREHGVDALGVDGPWTDAAITADLSADFPTVARCDLALCLEVAEHLPAARAKDLVAWLTSLAPTVVFSAAIPGQGGTGHVNEQWPAYWRDLFAAHGYEGTGALRWFIWDDDRIEPWYRQNLLVFGELGSLNADACLPVVHPGIWKVYRR